VRHRVVDVDVDVRRVGLQRGVEVLLRGVERADELQQPSVADERPGLFRGLVFGQRLDGLVL